MSQQMDFGVGQPYLRDVNNVSVNPNTLTVGQQASVCLSIFASNFFETVGGGGTTLTFDLGSHLEVVDVNKVSVIDLSENQVQGFEWSLNGNILSGKQGAELPKDFNATVKFDVTFTATTAKDVIKAEWKITDENVVVDYQPLNNSSTMIYTVLAVQEPVVAQPPTQEETISKIETSGGGTATAPSQPTPKKKEEEISVFKKIIRFFKRLLGID